MRIRAATVLSLLAALPLWAGATTLALDGRTGRAAPHCKALDLQDAITMEAWIKPHKTNDGTRLIDKDDDAYLLDTWPGASLRMIAGNVATRFAAKLPADRWSHVAGVYSRPDGIRKLYVDGKEVASTGAKSMPRMARNTNPLRIGCGTRTPAHRFRGEMDRVTIYNRALTAEEIAALAADETHKSHGLAGAVADWNFETQDKGAYISSAPGAIRLLPVSASGAVARGPMATLTGQAPPPEGRLTLWYRAPATKWDDAMPIGNGRLGAMVFGGVRTERIQLNEDTLWGGGPYDPSNPDALKVLPEVRRLIFAGKRAEASALAGRMMAKPLRQMPYQTVGDVALSFPGHEAAVNYRRELDLDSAVARVRYESGGVTYTREYFASSTAPAIVVRLTADVPGKIDVAAAATSPMQAAVTTQGDDLLVTGIGGEAQGVPGAIRYQARVRILAEGGSAAVEAGRLTVKGANAATLLITAATSYRNYKDASGDPKALAAAHMAAAAGKSYDALRTAHVAEHRRLFRRVSLDVGSSDAIKLPTNERIARFAKGEDPQLAEQYLQFGRYLLISCSRPGSQAANLQGIWNPHVKPPWESKYTININIQMNYWPAEMCNLAECHEPLLRLVGELVETGGRTAKVNYGARGWVCHHNTDVWRATAPIDGVQWGMWPTGGAWLCQHLWDHYLYGGDVAFLRQAYPVMKGAAQFFLDTLVEHPQGKWLVTCPSSSPEHGGLRAGPTMDTQIIRDLFGNCIEAARILGGDDAFRTEVQAARERLAPMQIGRHGQLQEWIEDDDSPADKHRHLSHLYGLHPSNQVTAHQTPKLFAAARQSLIHRGDGATGWSKAWKVNMWARMLDGDHAHKILTGLIAASTYPSMLDRCPPFVIDGNFGGTSGITEMLLQSHAATARAMKSPAATSAEEREVHLLPALPSAWPTGSVTGLRARGGFEVDIAWKEGKLTEAAIRSALGRRCTVRCGGSVVEFDTQPGKAYRLDGELRVR